MRPPIVIVIFYVVSTRRLIANNNQYLLMISNLLLLPPLNLITKLLTHSILTQQVLQLKSTRLNNTLVEDLDGTSVFKGVLYHLEGIVTLVL
jgi:hypothetical protein